MQKQDSYLTVKERNSVADELPNPITALHQHSGCCSGASYRRCTVKHMCSYLKVVLESRLHHPSGAKPTFMVTGTGNCATGTSTVHHSVALGWGQDGTEGWRGWLRPGNGAHPNLYPGLETPIWGFLDLLQQFC